VENRLETPPIELECKTYPFGTLGDYIWAMGGDYMF